MNFEKFVNRVLDQIKEYLPESFQDAEFVVRQHEKLNNQYAALTIANSEFAPIINLEDYFYDYEHGRSFHSIMGAISESVSMEQPKLDFEALTDFEKARDLLFIRVSSTERNADYLKNVPHTVMEDIAITYHLKMNMDEHGLSSAVISSDNLRMYGVSLEELHQVALKNSARVFPEDIFDLNERMKQNYIDDLKRDGMPDELIEEFLKEFSVPNEKTMTVVTNDVGVNGAAAIFYPGIMEKLAEMTGGDFFVLPSSVHETIVLPDNGSFSAKELEAMVTEINATQVEPWDRLTDQVYHYDPIDKVFEKASTFEERIEKKAEAERIAKKQSIIDKLGEKKETAKAMLGEKVTPLRTAEASL